MTPVNLIRLILRDAGVNGVGQTPTAEDNDDVFDTLNMMLATWSANRGLVYHLVDVFCITTGAQSYTVGPTGNIICPRPNRIEAAFFRSTANPSNLVDYPMFPLEAREDYNRIPVKTVGTWPSLYFYDSAYPTGVFYPFPVPTAGIGELHLSLKAPLGAFPDLTTEINLPPEYEAAIRWNGAVWVRPMYQIPADPVQEERINKLAKGTLATIFGSNAQIPLMLMPEALGTRRGKYNIYSDSFGWRY